MEHSVRRLSRAVSGDSAAPARDLLVAVAWLLMAVAVVPTHADQDLWGNLRFGLDILSTGRVSTVDQYSFTQDVPWINHDWLAQVMIASAYRLGGPVGLVALKVVLVGLALWLVAGLFSGSAPLVPEAAAGLVLWGALPITLTLRAQLWTFLSLAVLVRLLLTPSWRTRSWLPLLFAIWANCHIGWIIGLAVLLLSAAGAVIRGDRTERSRWLTITLLSLAATLVNPYGWRLWRFSIEMAHMSRDIQEWQPLWTSPGINWAPWGIALGLVFVSARRWLPFERLACLVGLAYVSMRALKFTALFVEATVMLVAPAFRQQFSAGDRSKGRPPIGIRLLNATAIGVVAMFVGVGAWPSFKCLRSGDWRPDAAAAGALMGSHGPGRLTVWFDWGEYAVWAFGPRLRVSFDPRYDLIYSPQTIHEQQAVGAAESAGTAFLARARPDYVWFPQTHSALKVWLSGHGYRIDVDTPKSFIGVRADLAPIQASAPEPQGCFPSP